MRKKVLQIIFLLTVSTVGVVSANIAERSDVKIFINEMVERHGFDKGQLEASFSKVSISDGIIKAISRPAEALPWYKYRPIFLKPERVKLGVEFWQENRTVLEEANKIYGVPVEIIVAIIGVETRYGQYKGRYKVLESLATLAFAYPKRAKFFRSELEQFLLLSREQGVDPLSLTGSYAGAMGMPQFISSSYRHYAVDFDGDGRIDIWNNAIDAIGSVGNYFKKHGWKENGQIIFPAETRDNKYLLALSKGLKPDIPAARLPDYGITLDEKLDKNENIKFLEYETETGSEYWLALQNFYVITRYNHSAMYAMAVYQLAGKIRNAYLAERQ